MKCISVLVKIVLVLVLFVGSTIAQEFVIGVMYVQKNTKPHETWPDDFINYLDGSGFEVIHSVGLAWNTDEVFWRLKAYGQIDTSGNWDKAIPDSISNRQNYYLDATEEYLSHANDHGYKVFIYTPFWYDDYDDSFNWELTHKISNNHMVDSLKGRDFPAFSLKSFMNSLNTAQFDEERAAIYGFWVGDEVQDAHSYKYYIQPTHFESADDNLRYPLPVSKMQTVRDSIKSEISDKKIGFTVNLYSRQNHAMTVDSISEYISEDYLDDFLIIDDTYALSPGYYKKQIQNVNALKNNVPEYHSAMFFDTCGFDSLSVFGYASLYRCIQLEVQGMWFYGFVKGYNTEQVDEDSLDKVAPYTFNQLGFPMSRQLAYLDSVGYLPFESDKHVFDTYDNNWDTIGDSDGDLPGRNLNTAIMHRTSTKSLLIVVNQTANTYNGAKILRLEKDEDTIPTSTVKVLFEDGSTQSRDSNKSHYISTGTYNDEYYISDDFGPWDAHVYEITYTSRPKAAAGENSLLPVEYKLQSGYPNPFNPATEIKYDLPETSPIVITVFDINGRLVTTLVNTEKEAGFHSVTWDGRNKFGVRVTSGVYLIRMSTPKYTSTSKVTLLK